jgi:uncharacterized protein (TIGR00251 family)
MVELRENAESVTLRLRIQPRASRTALIGEHAGSLKLKISSPPVDGKANEECRQFLADLFGVNKNAVEIIAGASSRNKVVRIRGASTNDILNKLRETQEL